MSKGTKARLTELYLLSSVNLGGLFVLEPFISPALYQKYPSAVDEWSLSTLMAADTASGGLGQLEDHYNTFIVSFCASFSVLLYLMSPADRTRYCRDSRCGIELGANPGPILGDRNMARRTLLGQNELEVCLFHPLLLGRRMIYISINRYILRVFAWCRKYGIRVNLDLHTIPGSQNGARFI